MGRVNGDERGAGRLGRKRRDRDESSLKQSSMKMSYKEACYFVD